MSDHWYIGVEGKASGPFGRATVEEMRQNGQVTADTLVWHEGMESWITYDRTGLRPPLPPPLPSVEAALPEVPPPLPRAHVPTAGSGHEPSAQGTHTTLASDSESPETPQPPTLVVEDDGWQQVAPAPWRRWLARSFDMAVLGLGLWALIGAATAIMVPSFYQSLTSELGPAQNTVVSSILTGVLLLPILALLIGFTGSSPGKWLFGVRVTRRSGAPIGLREALWREFHVLMRGLGFGIPLVSLVTQVVAYQQLTRHGATTWDLDQEWVITHRPNGAVQIVLGVLGVVVVLVALAWAASLR